MFMRIKYVTGNVDNLICMSLFLKPGLVPLVLQDRNITVSNIRPISGWVVLVFPVCLWIMLVLESGLRTNVKIEIKHKH